MSISRVGASDSGSGAGIGCVGSLESLGLAIRSLG